jgi:hypothetical protein
MMTKALFRSIFLCTVWLFAPGGAVQAADLLFPVQTDTYLDSQTPATNYGASGSVKVLINNNVTRDGSVCRGLFELPPEVALQDLRKLAKAQICFYVFNNQTAGRNITLYPLTRAFAEGTGAGDGATWNTFDGTNAWTNPGGDFDAGHPVVGVRGADGFFRWDITALLADASTRSNLLNHGALLQIDEIPVPTNGTPRAPFTSSEGAAAERPHVQWTLAAPFSFPIAADAYLDSRSANAAKNYGAATTVKVLINSSDASVCRGLIQLPPELDLYASGDIAEATLYFYLWQDNTEDRDLTLYPLTRAFAEGTGNGTAPADGATWTTCDGTNAWTTAGGDFDTHFPVVGIKEEILDPDVHDRFFSWDLTSLLTNEVARSNLLAHGALLAIDELPVPATGMPRAPFTSSDDLAYAAAYRPHGEVKILLATPEVPQMSVAAGRVTMDLAGCTPLVTNRIERTLDLLQTDGWTFVTNVVSTGSGTNWTEVLQPEWTNAFYRVVAVP